VGLERGSLRLVSKTDELIGRNSRGFSLGTENMAMGIQCTDHVTPLSARVGTTFADKWQPLGIVRSWTKATEFSWFS
jgi:hypothetical protein